LKLPRPPLVEERLLAVVDGQWRTAREIHAMFDEGSLDTVRGALLNLAKAGKVEREQVAHPTQVFSRYRRPANEP
jgi:hypothetical protein